MRKMNGIDIFSCRNLLVELTKDFGLFSTSACDHRASRYSHQRLSDIFQFFDPPNDGTAAAVMILAAMQNDVRLLPWFAVCLDLRVEFETHEAQC
jgi:hypothetical protein